MQNFLDAKKRIRNLRIAIVGPERFIRAPAVLDIAAKADTSIVILHMNGRAAEYPNVFEAVYREGFILPPDSYTSLATTCLIAALTAQKAEKGRILETLLAFLLSQVPGFCVKETKHNTATEEIDIVVHNRRIGGILAVHQEPLILVECKNQVAKAGKTEYVSFASKIKNRHKAASVGFFISINGYTRDFIEESLRDSHERIIVARLSRSDLEQWAGSHGEDAAALLDALVGKAILE